MDTMTSDKQTEQRHLVHEPQGQLFSGPPRSGELSPFAAKLGAEVFVCLCSVVVFGATANFGNNSLAGCTSLCGFAIATGVISFIISLVILLGQALSMSNRVDKAGMFSATAERNGMFFLVAWWAIGVAFLSSLEPNKLDSHEPVQHSSGVGIMFGWLAFFGSIYAAFKALHAEREEERSLHYAQVMSIRAVEDEEYANFS